MRREIGVENPSLAPIINHTLRITRNNNKQLTHAQQKDRAHPSLKPLDKSLLFLLFNRFQQLHKSQQQFKINNYYNNNNKSFFLLGRFWRQTLALWC
jgi:hypothetical protein